MENNTNTNIDVNNTQTEETTVETYTLEEVQKMIQSESDKRVQQALQTQQKKFDKQLSLAKLDDNERALAESTDRIAELEAQLAQYAIEKNKSEIKSVLGARGLSPEFADLIVITDDITASQANIDAFDKLFKAAVSKEVTARLAASGGSPVGNNSVAPEAITKEMASKMSVRELQALKDSNPEVFNKLY